MYLTCHTEVASENQTDELVGLYCINNQDQSSVIYLLVNVRLIDFLS